MVMIEDIVMTEDIQTIESTVASEIEVGGRHHRVVVNIGPNAFHTNAWAG
jgi:hypothetical protein